SDDYVPGREMFHAPGFGYGYCDVNDSRHGRHVRHRANFIRIIDAVLQTNHCGIWPNEWSHLSRGRRRIVGFDTEKNKLAVSNCAHLDCRGGPDSLRAI